MVYDGDQRRLFLWIVACLSFFICIASSWYWFYLHYYRKPSSSNLLPRRTGCDIRQAQSEGARQQGFLTHPVQSGHTAFELDTADGDSRWEPVAAPTQSIAPNERGGHHPNQVPMSTLPALAKESLAQPRRRPGDQHTIELPTDERRNHSVSGSEPSGSSQSTPETWPHAAQTPDGQRTPLPRYTLEPYDTNPPVYAESEPSVHVARAPSRRPTC